MRTPGRASLAALLLTFMVAVPATGAPKLYVDSRAASAHPDGAGWDSALPSLEQALDLVQVSRGETREIRLSGGRYVLRGSDRMSEHLFPGGRGLRIIGGMAGGSAAGADRFDPERYPTRLEIEGEPPADLGFFADGRDGSFHVVSARYPGEETVFDGIEVSTRYASPFGDLCEFLNSPLRELMSVQISPEDLARCGQSSLVTPPQEGASAPSPPSIMGGVDARVNNPATDAHPNEHQNETSIAVKDQTLCVAFNDLFPLVGGERNYVGFARSGNLGGAFTDQGSLGRAIGDPVIIARPSDLSDFAIAYMCDDNANPGAPREIQVKLTQDGCTTFPLTHFVRQGAMVDKPWIAVDRTGGPRNGNIYVTWTEFVPDGAGGFNSEIRFRRGIPFTDPIVTVATAPSATNLLQGSQVAVSNAGDVYVAWEAGVVLGQPAAIWFSRWRAGQAAFDAPVKVRDIGTRARDAGVAGCGAAGGLGPAATPIRIQEFPSLAAHPGNNDVYLVWNERSGGGAGNNVDIFFARSADKGATWPAVSNLTPTPANDQFEPNMTCSANGSIKVIWYDRRRDPNNVNCDVYAAQSDNGGADWATRRISDGAFGLDAFVPVAASCYMGEYNGITTDGSEFYMVWGDNRDVTAAAGHGGAAHLDPNVYFDKQSVLIVNKTLPGLIPAGLLMLLAAMGLTGAGVLMGREQRGV